MTNSTWTNYADPITEAFPAVHGFKVVLLCGGRRDVVVVSSGGIEFDYEAVDVAVAAGRLGYPGQEVKWVEMSSVGTWCPTGHNANEEGTAIWAD